MLNSQKGREHRSKRPIEPEAVFGQMKFNKQYKRFRHRGIDKVQMDFAIFVMAFNLQKLFRRLGGEIIRGGKTGNYEPNQGYKSKMKGEFREIKMYGEQTEVLRRQRKNKGCVKSGLLTHSHLFYRRIPPLYSASCNSARYSSISFSFSSTSCRLASNDALWSYG